MITKISIKFRLDPGSLKRPTKLKPVLAYIRAANKTIVRTLDIKVNARDFNENNDGSIRASHPDSVELNNKLKQYKLQLEEKLAIVTAQNPEATLKEIIDYNKLKTKKKKHDIFSIFDEYIQQKKLQHLRRKIKKDTVQKYQRVKNHLELYAKYIDQNFNLLDIDSNFLDKYFIYLVNKVDMYNNTAHKQISMLKGFLTWCAVNNYKINPNYKGFKEETKDNDIIFLTDKEIKKIQEVKLNKPYLERSRDLFLFQLYLGKRWSEIETISNVDITGNKWKLLAPKTETLETVILPPPAIAILKKYKNTVQPYFNKYGQEAPLPLISNQKQNQFIKEVCKLAKIDQEIKIYKYKGSDKEEIVAPKWQFIGTHSARRTFITKSILSGIPNEITMSLSGHKDYKSFKKYLKVTTEAKEKAINKLWK